MRTPPRRFCRRRPFAWAFLVVVLALSGAQRARAQAVDTHYQTLLVGDRSMGMGTAFTGLANDGSAVYYNPGGLVNRARATITGGFWLTAFDRKELHDGLRRSFGEFDVVSRGAPSYPAFVASTVNVGKKDAEGLRPYVLALSSFQTRREQFHSVTDMLDPVTGAQDTLEIDHEERDTYLGLTLARRFERVIGAGVSLFLAQRRLYHRENAFVVSGQDPFDIDQSSGVSSQNRVKMRSYLLVMRFGVLKKLTDRLRLGLTFQPPGIPLKSRADRRFQRLRYALDTAPGQAAYDVETSEDLRSRAPVPLELRAGIAHRPLSRLTWTADLQLVVPLVDREVIVRQRERAVAREASLFLAPTTKRVPVLNVALGLEARLSRVFMGTLGVFTDFSSAPAVPRTADVYQAARVQRVGLTATIAARGNDRGLALGIAGVLGRGEGLGVNFTEEAGQVGYLRSGIRSRTVFISLTGAIETAEQLARVAASKVAPGRMEPAKLDLPWDESQAGSEQAEDDGSDEPAPANQPAPVDGERHEGTQGEEAP